MKYTIVNTPEDMAVATARRIAAVIREKQERGEKAVIGLATGSTPIKVYEELVRMHNEEGLSFKNVVTFNLDEYVVDPSKDKDFYNRYESYHGFMHEHLFKHIDIEPKNVHIPDGMAPDLKAECERYERAIKDVGGIDLQLVGIGKSGHLGFNEAGKSPIDGPTWVVDLNPETVQVNQEKFKFAAKQAITMGLGTIMKAREVLLIANDDSKAKILKDTGRAAVIPRPEGWTSKQHRDAINNDVQFNPSRILHYHPKAEAIVTKDAGAYMLISPEELSARR